MEIRYDYASGTTVSGRKVRVSYQVFKGNRYWFFAGGSEDGVRMEIAVRDPAETPSREATSPGNNSATFHFEAKRTMLVTIEVTGHTQPGEEFGWAVVYGFQGAVKPASKAPGRAPRFRRLDADGIRRN